jgi:uncharacterized caspase-like protein
MTPSTCSLASRLVFIAFCFGALTAHAGERVALLIANQNYNPKNEAGRWSQLQNPANDVREIGIRLKKLGWTVMPPDSSGKPAIDLSKAEMVERITQLVTYANARNAAQILVYYSGHGQEWQKGSYLIGVDARNADQRETLVKGLQLQDLVSILTDYHGLKAIFVDACRTAPSKGNSGGLPNPNVTRDDLIFVYAAKANHSADDWSDNNTGLFAHAFSRALDTPFAEPHLLQLVQTTEKLMLATGKVQVPDMFSTTTNILTQYWFGTPRAGIVGHLARDDADTPRKPGLAQRRTLPEPEWGGTIKPSASDLLPLRK